MEMALQGEFDGLDGTSDLKVTEIANLLLVDPESVRNAIVAIKAKTGYIVPYVKAVGGRKKEEW